MIVVFRKRPHAIHRICGNIIVLCVLTLRSWLSVVAVVTTLWAGQPGNHGEIFLFSSVQTASGGHPSSLVGAGS